MTKDGIATQARTRVSSRARMAALTAVAALTLAACSVDDGYIDAYWDNGDPVYSPTKDTLFDENGEAMCDTPTVYRDLETRSRSFTSSGGVVLGVLFEIINDEPDPEGADDDAQRARYERLQGSLETLYQLTHPRFDAENGISEPADLAPLKEEWREHLDGLGEEASLDQYVRQVDEWLDTPSGRFNVRRVSDIQGYIEDNAIPHRFNGLRYNYMVATLQGGDEYLMITGKDTGDTELLNANERIDLDEDSELYVQYEIDLSVGFPDLPEAQMTLANDQCPSIDGQNVARFWLYDFELLDGTEPEPVELI